MAHPKTYPDKLHFIADTLEADGYALSAEWARDAAGRMQSMEQYIVKLHREFFPDTVPKADDGPESSDN